MSIQEHISAIKSRLSVLSALGRGDVFVVFVIILVGFGSFGLGRLSKISSSSASSVRIENVFENLTAGAGFVNLKEEKGSANTPPADVAGSGEFVGSKNSDKYHYPWCSGAQRIKDANKVFFASRADAERAGYTPAGNCKGL